MSPAESPLHIHSQSQSQSQSQTQSQSQFYADSEDTWNNPAQIPDFADWDIEEEEELKVPDWDFDAYSHQVCRSPTPPSYSPLSSWSPLPPPLKTPEKREYTASISTPQIRRRALKCVFNNTSGKTLDIVDYDSESAFQIEDSIMEPFRFSFKPSKSVFRKLEFN
jgi:hypothetical protein